MSVRPEASLGELLASVARLVSETVGFGTIAVDLYRPAWDDFEVFVVHGPEDARAALLGRRRERSFLEGLLLPQYERRGTYLVPHERRPRRRFSYVPRIEPGDEPDAWHPEDALLVPLRHSQGHVLGIVSLDEPISGRRPTDGERDVLAALAAQAAWAIEAAQDAAAAAQHGAALAELMRVSARLGTNESAGDVLEAVCGATRATLGFDVVAVELVDREADRYRPAAAAGIQLAAAVLVELPTVVFDRVFDTAFETEGCYLLGNDEARARLGVESARFRSTANGRGQRAWNRHWLLVPLCDGAGERIGFIWADDPRDCLLPSRPTLQALRLFADQAEAAIAHSERLHALHEAGEERRTLIDASPLGIVHLDVDRRVRSWNPAARRMFGYPDELVLGQEPPWIPVDQRTNFRRRFDAQFEQEVSHAVYTDRRLDGSPLEVETTSAPLLAPDGTPTGMIAVLADITEQEEAKRKVARREAEMRAMLESSPVALMRLDREGRTIWWSPAAERIFGWTAAEAVGRPPLFVPAEAKPEFERALATVLAGESIAGAERARVRKDGTPIQVRLSASPVYAEDGTIDGVTAALEDVTALSRTEEDLAARNAELEALHETALRLSARRDRESLLADIVSRATGLVEAPHGWIHLLRDDELVFETGIGVFSRPPVERTPRHAGLAGRVVETGTPCTVDDYSSWPDRILAFEGVDLGAVCIVPLHAGSDVVGVLGVGRNASARRFDETDVALLTRFGQLASLALENARLHEAARCEIAERREVELSLSREKEYSERLIQTANALIVGVDREGRIMEFNEEAQRLTGYAKQEVLGRSWLEVADPEQGGSALRSWFEPWAAGRGSVPETFENVVVTRTGEERLISWRNREVVVDGMVRGLLSFGIDLTEQRRVEEQLRHSQKLEAIGQLTAGIAHDFNNLLTAITGYGELALAEAPAETPAGECVVEMTRAAERAGTLTRQLLAFGRRQVLHPVPLDLNSLLTGLEPMLSRVLGAQVELVLALDPELGCTTADPGQIEQVVVNLAINARDAMPQGGRLLLETADVELDEAFAATHPGASPGAYVSLSVSDDGVGMDESTQARLFEPFFTTKPAGEGTGLGLSTAYGIIKQTGGSIWVYSEPGRGTTFKVYLPRDLAAGAEQPTETATETGFESPAGGTGTVLLAEDDGVVRSLVERQLRDAGYAVIAASDPAEAERLAAEHEGLLDLLVTDVVMPGMSGIELAERLLARQPDLPVLYTSGYPQKALAEHREPPWEGSLLEKPFTTADLRRKVGQLLDNPRRPPGNGDGGGAAVE